MPRGHSPHIPARPAPRPDRAPGTPRSDSPPIARPGGSSAKPPVAGPLPTSLPSDLYRVADAAALIGVREEAIRKLVRAGVIPTYGRHNYYHVSLADLLPRIDRPFRPERLRRRQRPTLRANPRPPAR